MVNHSNSVYYSAISLLIKESTKSPLFVNYAPALGTSITPVTVFQAGLQGTLPEPTDYNPLTKHPTNPLYHPDNSLQDFDNPFHFVVLKKVFTFASRW